LDQKNGKNAQKFQLLGWLLFIVSAAFFIASSVRNGDMVGLLGGFFFLVACFVFLVPFMGRGVQDEKNVSSGREYHRG
jgi:F0F1-type ATP synthase assembly protein I